VELTGPDEARGYVEAFLEMTRGAMVIVQVVTDLDELRWRPGSSAEEAAKASPLADPRDMAPEPPGFRVELTLVVDQVQRNTFQVGANGEIESSYRILFEGLPLPIAR
jgi:hypothetical protein